MKKRLLLLLAISFLLLKIADSQTTITLQPGPEGKDAYLNDYYTTNYGDYPNAFCVAGTHSGFPFISRSAFEFDLTSIPPGSIILDAKLSLYFANNSSNPYFHYGENNALLQRITEVWDEHEVTWYNQPSTTTENQVELQASISEIQDYTDIDVIMLIQDMVDDPENSHGILLKLQVEEMYRRLMFASGDHENPLKWPKLEITYTTNPGNTIIIQPGEEGKDAQVWSISPETNIGNTPKFLCSGWTHNGEPGINRGLIDFDLSEIPAGATILEAKLNFYFVCLEPNFFGQTGENASYLQLITDPWEEESVTWNTQPLTTETDQVYLPPSTDPYQDYTDIDVTVLIQKLYAEPESFHGLMLKLINEYPYNCLLFASSDYADTVEMRPKLEITYIVNPGNTIIIQPGEEGKDAQLWSIMPESNYGNTPKFVAMGWTHYGEPGINRAVIDFDLSMIPEGSQIVDAKLNFYFVCLEPNYFGHTGVNDAYLNLITEPWEENSITWNNQPMTTETDQLYLPPSTDPYQDYTDMDVTILIQKLFNEPDNYHGLMLKMIDEYPYHCLLFASSDYSDTIEMRPRLEVTYTTAPDYTLEIQPGPEEGKDAQLWTIMPDNNYGNIPKFDCSGWTHNGVPGVNRGIIDFDLSAIPDNAEITDAKLNFYFVCLEPTYFGHTGENDAYLQLITEPWEENSVTWNNQPLTTETDQLYLPPSTDPYMDYTDLDVTILMQKLHAEPENYHGLMLRLLNESQYRCLLFASSDYMDNVEMRPKLVITYTLGTMLPVADFNYETEGLDVYFENTSTNAEEYWWDFGDGYYSDLQDPWHIYDEPGIYTVTLTVWNEYGYDTVMKIITVPNTNAPEQNMAILKVYPNVAHDYITISTNIIGKTDLVIADSYGRPVINSTLEFSDGQTHQINVNQLNPGFYFARISKGNQADTRKLIISR